MKLFYFPDYRSTNPYQSLLYGACDANGLKTECGDIEQAIAFLSENQTEKAVFHLHWQNVIVGVAHTAHEHRILGQRFLQQLSIFKSLGGSVFWTIHNALPHETKFLKAELEFHRSLVSCADLIFLHEPSSYQVVNKHYHIPLSKVHYIEHGNYVDAYPNSITKSHALDKLRLPIENFTYGFIGQLRPYKGLDSFIDASYHFINDKKITALIAGKAVWPYSNSSIAQMSSALSNISIFQHYIEDDNVQTYMNACDVIVLPYKQSLCSGSLILAASFNKVVVIPALESFSSWLSLDFVFSYEADNPIALAETLARLKAMSEQELIRLGKSAGEYAASLSWNRAGEKICELANRVGSKAEHNYYAEYEVSDISKRVALNANTEIERANADGIALCVVNYFSHKHLHTLATSLDNLPGIKLTLFVLDNSCNGQEYAALCAIPRINVLIKSAQNLGYAGGNNALLSLAKAHAYERLAILNPDTEFSNSSIFTILKQIKVDKRSVYSPLILRDADTISFATATVDQSSKTLNIEHKYDGENKNTLVKGIHESDTLNGCALFFNAGVLDAFGYMPEEYFLYFEETDWCQSIKQQGGGLLLNSDAEILHHKSTQAGGIPSLAYTYYLLRNAVYFAKKHGYNPQETQEKYQESFVVPWSHKIQAKVPQLVNCFKAVAKLAFQHAEEGRTGQQDFLLQLQPFSEQQFSSEGFIEARTKNGVLGWAVKEPGKDVQPAELLLINKQKFESVFECTREREDLVAHGFTMTAGFDTPIFEPFDGTCIEIVNAHSLKPLGKLGSLEAKGNLGAEQLIDRHFAVGDVRAYMHVSNQGKLVGWAFDTKHPNIPLELELLVDGEVSSVTTASIYRQDLELAGKNNGKCGFVFHLNPKHIKKSECLCEVRLKGGSVSIVSKRFKTKVKRSKFKSSFDMRDFLQWSYANILTPYGAFEKAKSLQTEIAEVRDKLVQDARDSLPANPPLVSVIMPAYNRRDEINIAIASVYAQSYDNFELLVIDDGSKDDTVEMVQADDRLKLISMSENQGVSAARNAGLAASTGSIITYLDTDNEWHPEYLNICVAKHLEHDAFACAYAGQEIWYTDPCNQHEFRTHVRMLPFNRSALEHDNFIDLNVFSHKRSAYEQYGGFNEKMRRLVDWELILRYTKEQTPLFIPALLNKYYYGFADNQITKTEAYEPNFRILLEVL